MRLLIIHIYSPFFKKQFLLFILFRIIVRFFDDYGWKGKRAGEFNGLMAHLQELKCDIAATGLLLREDRFPVIDHMDSPYRLQ